MGSHGFYLRPSVNGLTASGAPSPVHHGLETPAGAWGKRMDRYCFCPFKLKLISSETAWRWVMRWGGEECSREDEDGGGSVHLVTFSLPCSARPQSDPQPQTSLSLQNQLPGTGITFLWNHPLTAHSTASLGLAWHPISISATHLQHSSRPSLVQPSQHNPTTHHQHDRVPNKTSTHSQLYPQF